MDCDIYSFVVGRKVYSEYIKFGFYEKIYHIWSFMRKYQGGSTLSSFDPKRVLEVLTRFQPQKN